MHSTRKWLGVFLAFLLTIQGAAVPGIAEAGDEGQGDPPPTQIEQSAPAPPTTVEEPKQATVEEPKQATAEEPMQATAEEPKQATAEEEKPAPAEAQGGSAAPPEPMPDPLLQPAPADSSSPPPVNITEIPRYLVDFYSYDGVRIASQYVEEGQAAIQPRPPAREGYAFTGWQPPVDSVTGDMATTATYHKLRAYSVIINYYYEDGGDPVARGTEEYYMEGEAVDRTYEPVAVPGYEPNQALFSVNTDAIDRDYAFDFIFTASADTTYRVEHLFEGLQDGLYAADSALTQHLSGRTGAFVRAEPLPDEQIVGFTVTALGEGRIAADGSTVLQVSYSRLRFTVTFDTGEGSEYIQPMVLQYGAPVRIPGTVLRDGYTFDRWTMEPSGGAGFPGTMPASDLLFTAQWSPQRVPYRLIYWLEETNISGDPGNDPNQYAFNQQEERQAVAGSLLSLSAADLDNIPYAMFSHADQNVIVKGDGSAIVNVYFKRILYTVTFSLNTSDPTVTMQLNGQSYSIRNPYVINVKYQQDIGAIWPSLKNTDFSSGFYAWHATFDPQNWVSHRFIFTGDMIPPTGTSFVVSAVWNSNLVVARVNYWFETLPGDGGKSFVGPGGMAYTLSAYDSQDIAIQANSTFNTKEISGMDVGQKPANLQFRAGDAFIGDYSSTQKSKYNSEFNFFYLRLRYALTFNVAGDLDAPAAAVIPYGMPLDAYDPRWDGGMRYTDTSGVTFTFAGWYEDASCLVPFRFTGTMPNRNMTLFAQWTPQAFDVTFIDRGAELACQTVDGGGLVETVTPEREGYMFMGWFTDPEGTKAFSYTEKIYRDTVLYAVWAAGYSDYTVKYLMNGPGGAPVDGYADKVVRHVPVDSTVTEAAAMIPSYFADSLSKSLVPQPDPMKNVIEFYYIQADDVPYVVRYIDSATGQEIPGAPEKHATTSSARIVESYLAIPGYTPLRYQISAWLSADAEENVLEFLYNANTPEQYTVQHMVQIGVWSDGGPIYRQHGETEVRTGAVGGLTHAEALDLSPQYVFIGGNEPQVIRPDIQIHMILYYDARHTVVFSAEEGGELMGTAFYEDIPSGAFFSVVAPPEPVAHPQYVFIGWDRTFPERIEQDWLFIARFEPMHELVVTAGSAVKVYDGKPLVDETYSFNQDALLEGHMLQIYTNGSITGVGKVPNVLTYAHVWDQEDNDVTGMYRIALNDGMLEITPVNIPIIITAAGAAKRYDGMPLTAPAYDADASLLCEGDRITATVEGSCTDVGTAENAVTSWQIINENGEDVSQAYIVYTVDGLLTVLQTPLAVTAASDQKYYDGTPLTNPHYTLDQAALAAGHGVEAEVWGAITNVGQAVNRIESLKVVDAAGQDVSNNYRLIPQDGLLVIQPPARVLTITAASDSKIYDGTLLTNPGYHFDSSLLFQQHSLWVEISGAILNVGATGNIVKSWRIVDSAGEDVSSNYRVEAVNGILTITPGETELLIRADTAAKFYDGTPLTDPNYICDEALLAEGDVLTVTVEGSITNVGTAKNIVTGYRIVGTDGEDVTGNYTVAVAAGRLTVFPREMQLVITAASAQKVYDGAPLMDDGYDFDASLLCAGHVLAVTVTGSITEVGTAQNTVATWRIVDEDGLDVSVDYTVRTVAGNLTILPETPAPVADSPGEAPASADTPLRREGLSGAPYNAGETMQ